MQPEKLAAVFGANVRYFRRALSMTQQVLATAIDAGLGHNYISDIERGKTAPTLRTVAKFSQALGVEPSVLMSEMPAAEPAVKPPALTSATVET